MRRIGRARTRPRKKGPEGSRRWFLTRGTRGEALARGRVRVRRGGAGGHVGEDARHYFSPDIFSAGIRRPRVGVGVESRLLERLLERHLAFARALERHLVLLRRSGSGAFGAAFVGRGGAGRDFYTGVLFPLVILTMLIERFSISIAEEGTRESMTRLGWTMAVGIAVYPLFQSATLSHVMFGFPELVLVVMGLLVWIGGYMGYRLSELVRFRSLTRPEALTGA